MWRQLPTRQREPLQHTIVLDQTRATPARYSLLLATTQQMPAHVTGLGVPLPAVFRLLVRAGRKPCFTDGLGSGAIRHHPLLLSLSQPTRGWLGDSCLVHVYAITPYTRHSLACSTVYLLNLAGLRRRRSRLVLCLLILALNVGVHLTFLITYSFLLLPCPAASHCKSSPPPPPTSAQLAIDSVRPSGRADGNYLLLVLVLSSVDGTGRQRREAIRRTWMQGHGQSLPPVLVRFAVGTLELNPSDLSQLHAEQQAQGDLLFLSGLKESYTNLTRKVLLAMVELDRQFNFSYLLKCDDDSFVLLHHLTQELAQRQEASSLYWGFFDGRASPKRAGKWAEEGWFLCDHYLPYALGGGYVLSSDLVHRVAANADALQLYSNEDVSVGVWLGAFRAERKHDTRFNTEFVSRGCRNSYLVSHKQSLDDMTSKYRLLQTQGVQCTKEYQTRASYEYDWNSPPSKCCQRQRDIQ